MMFGAVIKQNLLCVIQKNFMVQVKGVEKKLALKKHEH